MRSLSWYAGRVLEQPRPVRFVASRLLKHLGLCRFLTIHCESYQLRFHPSSLSLALWIDPGSRKCDTEFLKSWLRPGDSYVDVGANIGHLAIEAKLIVGGRGTVVAIEPHPVTYRQLIENVQLNSLSIACHQCALGSDRGELRFTNVVSDDQNRVSPSGELRVPVDTLDRITGHLARIDLLKVDVEGYELFVFEGGLQALRRTAAVYFEAWDEHCARFGYRFADLERRLESSGFRIYRLEGRRCLPVEGSMPECKNLLAVSDVTTARERGYQIEA